MTNNQLEKGIFVIYKTDKKSTYSNSQRAITNQKLNKKKEWRIRKEALLGVVCVVGGRRRFTNIWKDITRGEN